MDAGRARAALRTHPSAFEYYKSKIPAAEIARIREECAAKGLSVHDALMERAGWPPIPFDGKLLVTHQDALLIGGKVQAPAATPITSCSFTPRCARVAARRSASKSVPARPSRGAGRRARLRPRQVRSLRRLSVELCAADRGRPRAHQHRFPCRLRRPALQ